MFIIVYNGERTILTGWRAWLAGVAVVVIAWLACGFVAFMMLGLAVTLGAIAMLMVPAILIIGLVSWVMRGQR